MSGLEAPIYATCEYTGLEPETSHTPFAQQGEGSGVRRHTVLF